ncbi:uncharacterized protein LOC128197788 [Vigna angularis]|uniref:uncharacterized protein LOC128197788 n=1 Tax=Phaseolus angularis TaxID=3914 RepID=UPI0022B4376D|nr:uncharacterized protein LOC128197788 [Vigna angularis]
MRSFSNRQTHPIQGHFHLFCLETRLILMAGIVEWFLRRKQRIDVLQKGIFPILKHPQKKISMLMLHSCVLPRLLLPMSTNKTYL